MDFIEKDLDSFEIGARVKAERKRLGLTQRKLCSVTGIAPPTMSLIEAGSRYPTVKFLNAFSDVGADLWFIVKGAHAPTQADQSRVSSLLLAYQEQLDDLLDEHDLIEESIGDLLNTLRGLQRRVRGYKKSILTLKQQIEKEQ